MFKLLSVSIAVVLLLVAETCFAHAMSDSFLNLNVEQGAVTGRWDVHLRDLEFVVGLDTDDDGKVTWAEFSEQRDRLAKALEETIVITTASGNCPLMLSDPLVAERSDGYYASFLLGAQCAATLEGFAIHYSFLFDIDAQHKGLVGVVGALGPHSAVLSAHSNSVAFASDDQSLWQTLRDYLVQGIWHIWLGFDHILFLLVLLLPAARYVTKLDGVTGARHVLWQVLKIVTAFSIAHSITLSLAAMDFIALPSRWVESAIAASVIVAAANSLVLRFDKYLPLLTFCFGLIHGFGFASVLGELGLPTSTRIAALVAFNIGVELGQLAIVATALPLILAWRKNEFYMRRAVPAATAAAGALAFLWLIERISAS